MGKHTIRFVIITIATTSILSICAHVLKDFRNKQLVLTSVYDAIKSSKRLDLQKAYKRNEINFDLRNKRNTGDKRNVYYDTRPLASETQTE